MGNCKQTIQLEVEQKIKSCLILLIRNDRYLLDTGINERSLTHQFAVYLAREFPEYDIDCEYNRNGLVKKKLRSFRKKIYSNNTDGVTVYPDIIVHQRGTKNNFIVIEAKKSSNVNNDDMKKLRAYKKELDYKYAVFIRFPVGKDLDTFIEDKAMDCIQVVDN